MYFRKISIGNSNNDNKIQVSLVLKIIILHIFHATPSYNSQDGKENYVLRIVKCVIYIIVNNILVFHEYFAISYFIYYIETYNVRLRRFLLYNKTLCTYEEMNVPDLAVYKRC